MRCKGTLLPRPAASEMPDEHRVESLRRRPRRLPRPNHHLGALRAPDRPLATVLAVIATTTTAAAAPTVAVSPGGRRRRRGLRGGPSRELRVLRVDTGAGGPERGRPASVRRSATFQVLSSPFLAVPPGCGRGSLSARRRFVALVCLASRARGGLTGAADGRRRRGPARGSSRGRRRGRRGRL